MFASIKFIVITLDPEGEFNGSFAPVEQVEKLLPSIAATLLQRYLSAGRVQTKSSACILRCVDLKLNPSTGDVVSHSPYIVVFRLQESYADL